MTYRTRPASGFWRAVATSVGDSAEKPAHAPVKRIPKLDGRQGGSSGEETTHDPTTSKRKILTKGSGAAGVLLPSLAFPLLSRTDPKPERTI